MTTYYRTLRLIAAVAVVALYSLSLATSVAAHTELETATPADGSTVPSPFDGPIVLTFTEALGDGSKADLLGSGGTTVASATVDGPGATMTFALDEALEPGDYKVEWTGVAVDGHVERGTVSFGVAPASTAAPSPSPTLSPEPTASAAPTTPSPEPTVSASPAPSPTPPEPVAASGGDVVLPIIAGLVVVGAGAAYLLTRRGRSTPGR